MTWLSLGIASLANTQAENAWKVAEQLQAGRVELDLDRRGAAGGQRERRLGDPDGRPCVLTCADGDDLLALNGLVGGDEDRPGAAPAVGARAAQPQRNAGGAELEADEVGQPGRQGLWLHRRPNCRALFRDGGRTRWLSGLELRRPHVRLRPESCRCIRHGQGGSSLSQRRLWSNHRARVHLIRRQSSGWMRSHGHRRRSGRRCWQEAGLRRCCPCREAVRSSRRICIRR